MFTYEYVHRDHVFKPLNVMSFIISTGNAIKSLITGNYVIVDLKFIDYINLLILNR